MIIIVDTREQRPFQFPAGVTVERGTLQTGDYSIKGLEHLFAIERKSIPDLVASVTWERPRFERELHRLRGFRFKRLVIEGKIEDVRAGNYRSNANPKAVLASLDTFECRYDIPVCWVPDGVAGGRLVAQWCYRFGKEIEKQGKAITA